MGCKLYYTTRKHLSHCIQLYHRYMFYFVGVHNYICEHSDTRPYSVLSVIHHPYVYTIECEAKQLHLCLLLLFGMYMNGVIRKIIL